MNLTVTINIVTETAVVEISALLLLIAYCFLYVTTTNINSNVTQYLFSESHIVTSLTEPVLASSLYLTALSSLTVVLSSFLIITDLLGHVDDTGYRSITTEYSYKSFIL